MQQDIIDQALEEKKAIVLDWRATIEDAVFNIKEIIPDFDIVSLGERQTAGDWEEGFKIGEQEHWVKTEVEDMMYQTFEIINDYLKNSKQIFLTTNIGDDNRYYVLVNDDSISKFEDLGFFRP